MRKTKLKEGELLSDVVIEELDRLMIISNLNVSSTVIRVWQHLQQLS